MKSIAVCIGKGGQWKTSLTINMAALLNENGFKTLVIDCDVQANATGTYRIDPEGIATLYDCWVPRKSMNPMQCIQSADWGDIIPGDSYLQEVTTGIISGTLTYKSFKEKVIDKIEGYDFILCDCPPDLTNAINRSVLSSVDEVIIPTRGDQYATEGLKATVNLIDSVRNPLMDEAGEVVGPPLNKELSINGLVFTDFKMNNSCKNDYINAQAIAEELGTKLYFQFIRGCKDGSDAIGEQMPAVKYKPYCNSSLDYKQFIQEFIESENESKKGV